jgi:hypothetical protein
MKKVTLTLSEEQQSLVENCPGENFTEKVMHVFMLGAQSITNVTFKNQREKDLERIKLLNTENTTLSFWKLSPPPIITKMSNMLFKYNSLYTWTYCKLIFDRNKIKYTSEEKETETGWEYTISTYSQPQMIVGAMK